MIWLYAFLIGTSGFGFEPIYGVGVESDWRPRDRVRIVANADLADAKKQYLHSGWSTHVGGHIEYATDGPLLGLGVSWVHNHTRTYTKDAISPFVLVGMTLEPGSRIYLKYSPDDNTINEVESLAFRWEYERHRWSADMFGGVEQFLDQQGHKRPAAFYGIRVARRIR